MREWGDWAAELSVGERTGVPLAQASLAHTERSVCRPWAEETSSTHSKGAGAA